MTHSLKDRLTAARRRHFVGRQQERDLFHSALAAAELPFNVLYLFGPGGVGKSSLLREYGYIARQLDVEIIQIDGRVTEPNPEAFLKTLQSSLNVPDGMIFSALAARTHRTAILIDTAELLTPLDSWWQEEFLPQLPDNVLVVIAGHNPPAPRWRADPGWQQIMRVHRLRNLTPEESRAYLMRRQVRASEHGAVLDFTYGHPLALSLVADLYAQFPETNFKPENAPDIIKTVLDHFLQELPTAAHRAALESCTLVRLMTEPLLGQMAQTDEETTRALFDWLRHLSFIDADRYGLYPHDLAREALAADLRWRNPERYARLHERARTFYMKQVPLLSARDQRRLLADYIYLHRDNPMVRPYFEWQSSGAIFTDTLRPQDEPLLAEMVAKHEGSESAQLVAYWLAQQPQGFNVMRQAGGQPVGFLCMVALEKTSAADRAHDPAVAATWSYLQQTRPPQADERATLFRYWLAAADYQSVSPVQSRIFLNIVQHYLTTPGLTYTFLPCADPDFWRDTFFYADLQRIPAADFGMGGRTYGVYGHDWQARPAMAWLTLLGEREWNPHAEISLPTAVVSPSVLGEEAFAAAVRQLLRDFTDDNRLRDNPLWHTQLRQHLDDADAHSPESLRQLIRQIVDPLQQSPRQIKLYRALHHTYFQPTATQEEAAELLDLPFSTYRRHLREGVDYLIKHLRQLARTSE
ncbi:MAG: ATP-binding protein [Caldilineaceae bacterium]|nr:ATP-binding protein [Caldilineaceae bacterium]